MRPRRSSYGITTPASSAKPDPRAERPRGNTPDPVARSAFPQLACQPRRPRRSCQKSYSQWVLRSITATCPSLDGSGTRFAGIGTRTIARRGRHDAVKRTRVRGVRRPAKKSGTVYSRQASTAPSSAAVRPSPPIMASEAALKAVARGILVLKGLWRE